VNTRFEPEVWRPARFGLCIQGARNLSTSSLENLLECGFKIEILQKRPAQDCIESGHSISLRFLPCCFFHFALMKICNTYLYRSGFIISWNMRIINVTLHFFEVRSNCVFSYTFGETFYLWLTDPKKAEAWKDEGYYVVSSHCLLLLRLTDWALIRSSTSLFVDVPVSKYSTQNCVYR
jgi:hypothetical protein